MPGWMKHLHGLLCSTATPVLTRLFIARLVVHVDRRHQERQAAEQVGMCACGTGNGRLLHSILKVHDGVTSTNSRHHSHTGRVCLGVKRDG